MATSQRKRHVQIHVVKNSKSRMPTTVLRAGTFRFAITKFEIHLRVCCDGDIEPNFLFKENFFHIVKTTILNHKH